MPLAGNDSYVPTCDAFLAHWDQAETALPGEITFRFRDVASFNRDGLDDLRSDMEAALDQLVVENNNLEFAWGDRDLKRNALHPRFSQFGRGIRFKLKDTPYVRMLPKVPSKNGAPAKINTAAKDVSDLWIRVDADASVPGFTPPLVLPNAYDLATFDTERTAMKAAFEAVGVAESSAKLQREKRNDLKKTIRAVLVEYRKAVGALFPPDDPIVDSLPKLDPPRGATPDPVNASGMWDEVEQKARLTWTESTDPNLASYSIRYSPGATYSTADEQAIGTVLAGETREFLTDTALGSPGTTAAFRVYVVLTTGNEKGSNTVKVERL